MKLFTTEQIRTWDQYTIQHEPILSIDLMERAAKALCKEIMQRFPHLHQFAIFCGPGNNGGDGMAIARMLLEQNKKIEVWIVNSKDTFSVDAKTNLDRLPNEIIIHHYSSEQSIQLNEHTCIVDAIFGSGIHKEPEGIYADCIQQLNKLPNFKIAIDVPSGLSGEDNRHIKSHSAVTQAHHTIAIQQPRISFFMAENEKFVGQWSVVNIGLHPEYYAQTTSSYFFIDKDLIHGILHTRSRFSHKGTFGHALLAAGSLGKTGAAVLSARACLRSGVGLLTVYIPRHSNPILQTAVPEAMTLLSAEDEHLDGRIRDVEKYAAIGIGPGIGQHADTTSVVKQLIHEYHSPIVFDADALNILAEHKTWLEFLPQGSILTPHPGEFDRLFGKHTHGYDRLLTQLAMSKRYGIYIVLKGAYSSVSTPGGNVYFNSTGNPGMATGGSGDVLTGILTGLLAQHYTPLQACILGVYVHGLAGDISLQHQSPESLIASDIINHLGLAFQQIVE
ncbi:MAG: NAD(P)H-hydrate dehydratase [Flavobacteriales bacterium]|nr:NAD(P)H-hydrate dehydratase [Flavobacteriales bacterium]